MLLIALLWLSHTSSLYSTLTSHANAGELYVDGTLADAGDCTQATGCNSLSAAVTAAATDAEALTIAIVSGKSASTEAAGYDISKTLTIQGASADKAEIITVDSTVTYTKDYIFSIAPTPEVASIVTFTNLQFQLSGANVIAKSVISIGAAVAKQGEDGTNTATLALTTVDVKLANEATATLSQPFITSTNGIITMTAVTFTSITRSGGYGAILNAPISASDTVTLSSVTFTGCGCTGDNAAGIMALTIKDGALSKSLSLTSVSYKTTADADVNWPDAATGDCAIVFLATAVADLSQTGGEGDAAKLDVKTTYGNEESKQYYAKVGASGLVAVLYHYLNSPPVSSDKQTIYVSTVGYDADTCGWDDLPCPTFATAYSKATVTTIKLATADDYAAETLFTANGAKIDKSLTVEGVVTTTEEDDKSQGAAEGAKVQVDHYPVVAVTTVAAGKPVIAVSPSNTASGSFSVTVKNIKFTLGTTALADSIFTLANREAKDADADAHTEAVTALAATLILDTIDFTNVGEAATHTASIIKAASGTLTLTKVTASGIKMNAKAFIESKASSLTFAEECSFSSITRTSGNGAVLECEFGAADTSLSLTSASFTDCACGTSAKAGAMYIKLAGKAGTLSLGAAAALKFEEGTNKYAEIYYNALTLASSDASNFGDPSQTEAATNYAKVIASFDATWNAANEKYYDIAILSADTIVYTATFKTAFTPAVTETTSSLIVDTNGADLPGCGIAALPCASLSQAYTLYTDITPADGTTQTITVATGKTIAVDNVIVEIKKTMTIAGVNKAETLSAGKDTKSAAGALIKITRTAATSTRSNDAVDPDVTIQQVTIAITSDKKPEVAAADGVEAQPEIDRTFAISVITSDSEGTVTLNTVDFTWTTTDGYNAVALASSVIQLTAGTLALTTVHFTGMKMTGTNSLIDTSTPAKLSLTAAQFESIDLVDAPLLKISTSAEDSLSMTGENQFQSITRSTGNGAVFSVTVTTGDVYLPISHATFTNCKCTASSGEPAALTAVGGSIYISTSVALKSFLGASLSFSGTECASKGLYIYYESTAADNTANLYSNDLPTLTPAASSDDAGLYVAKNFVSTELTEVEFKELTAKPVTLVLSDSTEVKESTTSAFLTLEAALSATATGYDTKTITLTKSAELTAAAEGSTITAGTVTITGASDGHAKLTAASLDEKLIKITAGEGKTTSVSVQYVDISITATAASGLSKSLFATSDDEAGTVELTLSDLTIGSGIAAASSSRSNDGLDQCGSTASVISFTKGKLTLAGVTFQYITIGADKPLLDVNAASGKFVMTVGTDKTTKNTFTSIKRSTTTTDINAGGAVFEIKSTAENDAIAIQQATFTDCGMADAVTDYNGGIIFISLEKTSSTISANSLTFPTDAASRSNAVVAKYVYISLPTGYSEDNLIPLRGFLSSTYTSANDKAHYQYLIIGEAAAVNIEDIPKPSYLKAGESGDCSELAKPCGSLATALAKVITANPATATVVQILATDANVFLADTNAAATITKPTDTTVADVKISGENADNSKLQITSTSATNQLILVSATDAAFTTTVSKVTISIKSITAAAVSVPVFKVTSTDATSKAASLSLNTVKFVGVTDSQLATTTSIIDSVGGKLTLNAVSFTTIQLGDHPLLKINTAENGFTLTGTNTFTSITRSTGNGAFLEETLAPAVASSSSSRSNTSPATKISIANAEFTDCSSSAGVGIMYFTVSENAPSDALVIDGSVTYKATPAATAEQPNPTPAAVDWSKMDEHSCAVGFYAATVDLFTQDAKYALTTLAASDSKQYYAKVGASGLVAVLHHYLNDKPVTADALEVTISSTGYDGAHCGWDDLPCSTFAKIPSASTSVKFAYSDQYKAETLFGTTGATVSTALIVDGETTTTTEDVTSSTYAKITVSSSSTTNPVITITNTDNADDIAVAFKNLDFVLNRATAIAVPVFTVSNYKAPAAPGVRENTGTGKVAVTLTRVTFTSTGSTAMTSAVIVQESGTLNIAGGCTFTNIAGKGALTSTLGSGDALSITKSDDGEEVTFDTCSSDNGGALSVTFSAESTGTLTLGVLNKPVTFKDCSATTNGGAICISSAVSITSLLTFIAAFEGSANYVYYEATDAAANLDIELLEKFMHGLTNLEAGKYMYKIANENSAKDMIAFLDTLTVAVSVKSGVTDDTTCQGGVETKECSTIAKAVALTEASEVKTGNTITIIGSGLTLSDDRGTITKGVTITGDANTKVTVTSAIAGPLFTIGTAAVTSPLTVGVSTMTIALTASDDEGTTGAIAQKAFEIGTLGTDGSVSLTLTSVTFTTSDDTHAKLAYLSTTLIDASKGTLTLSGCIFQYITLSDTTTGHPLITPSTTASQLILNKNGDALNTFTSITRVKGNGAVFAVTIDGENKGINLKNVAFVDCACTEKDGQDKVTAVAGAVYITLSAAGGTLSVSDVSFTPDDKTTTADKSAITFAASTIALLTGAADATDAAAKGYALQSLIADLKADGLEKKYYAVIDSGSAIPLLHYTTAPAQRLINEDGDDDITTCGWDDLPCATVSENVERATSLKIAVHTDPYDASSLFTDEGITLSNTITIEGEIKEDTAEVEGVETTTTTTPTIYVTTTDEAQMENVITVQLDAEAESDITVTLKYLTFELGKPLTKAVLIVETPEEAAMRSNVAAYKATLALESLTFTRKEDMTDPLTASVIETKSGCLTMKSCTFTSLTLADTPLITVDVSSSTSLVMNEGNVFTSISRTTGNGAVFSVNYVPANAADVKEIYLPIQNAAFTDCVTDGADACGGCIYVKTKGKLASFVGSGLTFSLTGTTTTATNGKYIYYEAAGEDATLYSDDVESFLSEHKDTAADGDYVAKLWDEDKKAASETLTQFSALESEPVSSGAYYVKADGTGKGTKCVNAETPCASLSDLQLSVEKYKKNLATIKDYTVTIQSSLTTPETSTVTFGFPITISGSTGNEVISVASMTAVQGTSYIPGVFYIGTDGEEYAITVKKLTFEAKQEGDDALNAPIFDILGDHSTSKYSTLTLDTVKFTVKTLSEGAKVVPLEKRSLIESFQGKLILTSVSFTGFAMIESSLLAINPVKDCFTITAASTFTSITSDMPGSVFSVELDTEEEVKRNANEEKEASASKVVLSFSLSNAEFVKCSTTGGFGGAVFVMAGEGSIMTVNNVKFTQCSATFPTEEASLKKNAEKQSAGGGMFVMLTGKPEQFTWKDTTFTECTADSGSSFFAAVQTTGDEKVDAALTEVLYSKSLWDGLLTGKTKDNEFVLAVVEAAEDGTMSVKESKQLSEVAPYDDDDSNWSWWMTFLIVIAGIALIAAIVIGFIYLLIIRPKKVSPEGEDSDKSVRNPPTEV